MAKKNVKGMSISVKVSVDAKSKFATGGIANADAYVNANADGGIVASGEATKKFKSAEMGVLAGAMEKIVGGAEIGISGFAEGKGDFHMDAELEFNADAKTMKKILKADKPKKKKKDKKSKKNKTAKGSCNYNTDNIDSHR
jgi:hypothetical protein